MRLEKHGPRLTGFSPSLPPSLCPPPPLLWPGWLSPTLHLTSDWPLCSLHLPCTPPTLIPPHLFLGGGGRGRLPLEPPISHFLPTPPLASCGHPSLLGLPLVRGLLLPGQPVAGLQAQGQPTERRDGRSPGRHRLLLLLHLHVGEYAAQLAPPRLPSRAPGAGGLSAEPGTLFSLPPQCLQGEGGNCSPRKKTAAIASGDRQVVTTDPAFGVVTGSPPSHSSIWVVESCCPLLQMRNLRPRGQDKASRFYTGKEPRLRGDLGQTLGPPLIFWASICPSVK